MFKVNLIKNIKYFNRIFSEADLEASALTCMGISTQRATFTTWKKSTGQELHNFITWKDTRAEHLVKQWNSSLSMKVTYFN